MSGVIKPISNDHSASWHAERFVAFARAKDAIGEPTPHMRVVTWMAQGLPLEERVWRAGCYLAGYSVLTGEAIWHYWPWERVARGADTMQRWLTDNWGGVHTRKPRRCVRTPHQFNECLMGFAHWMRAEFPRLRASHYPNSQTEYDVWWASATTIPYYGRYLAIRLLELMRRWDYMQAHLHDIRAVGAHSPIRCLMLLRPEECSRLATGGPDYVNGVAEGVKAELAARGVPMSYFTFATLLCEYRACYEDGGDYAGNQHDEELEYSLSKHADFWRERGLESRLYPARAAIDPHECLGELNGWRGRRTDVAAWMRERGCVWSGI